MLTGEIGKLMVGYNKAATLVNWTLTCQQQAIGVPINTLSAVLADVHAYWIDKKPVIMALWMGSAWWVWYEIEVTVEGNSVSIKVWGNPEARYGI